MLENLITSKTRVKLLLKLFLNSQNTAYLRNLEAEFGESTNAIRQELNRFEKAGLVLSTSLGNKKVFKANTNHPFFPEINKLLLKYTGIDKIVDEVVMKIGELQKAFITGDFAKGKKGLVLDLILIGSHFDASFITKLIGKAEELTSLKIRYITIAPEEEGKYINGTDEALLIWSTDK